MLKLLLLLCLCSPFSLYSHEIHGQKINVSDKDASVLKRLLGEYPPQAWSKEVSCEGQKLALCHLEKVFPNKKTATLVYEIANKYDLYFSLDQIKTGQSMKIKYDYQSYYSYPDYPPKDLESFWNFEQMTVVKSVLDTLPLKMKSFDHMKDVYLIPDGYFLHRGRNIPRSRPSTVAVTQPPAFLDGELRREGFMAFFPVPYYKFGDNEETRMTLIHELAHALDHQREGRRGQNLSDLDQWRSISWERDGYRWMIKSPKLFVTKYAQTAPVEDFAESVAFYFKKPEVLKKVSIEKYNFIDELMKSEEDYNY